MWNGSHPIRTDWLTGTVHPQEVLYEMDGPVFFVATVGLSNYFFFKKAELEESDLFLACVAELAEVEALKEGRLSIRGALNKEIGWLIEMDFDHNVVRFQRLALLSNFGDAPNTLAQANAFMAFKFYSQVITNRLVPLRLLTETVEGVGVSKFVRGALTPLSLVGGRDGRFFDVQVGEPLLASLLISIERPTIDAAGLRDNKRTSKLSPTDLEEASVERGRETWNVIQQAIEAFNPQSTTQFNALDHREFLENIVDLMPSQHNEFEKLEITIRRGKSTQLLTIDRQIGEKLIQEHHDLDGKVLSIEGVITEVNGESDTFLLRDNSYWVTTCSPLGGLFQQLDDAGVMNRGQRMRVTGKYWRRTRRGFLSFDEYPIIL